MKLSCQLGILFLFIIAGTGCVLPPHPVLNTAKPLGRGNIVVNVFQRGYYSSARKKSVNPVGLQGVKGVGIGYGLGPALDLHFFLEKQEKAIPTLAINYSWYKEGSFFSSVTGAYSMSQRHFSDGELSDYQFMQVGLLNTYYWRKWLVTAHISLNNAMWKTNYNVQGYLLKPAKSNFRIIIPGEGNILYEQLDLSLQYKLWRQLRVGPFINLLLHHKSHGDVEIEFVDRKILSSFFWGISFSAYF
ncbi:MAG: hypothetical protein HAW63_05480 [Bdellovibrionaceae bacterium]|nr:hypothetical protein [Pseudobdellovibrionaceae bacterium]